MSARSVQENFKGGLDFSLRTELEPTLHACPIFFSQHYASSASTLGVAAAAAVRGAGGHPSNVSSGVVVVDVGSADEAVSALHHATRHEDRHHARSYLLSGHPRYFSHHHCYSTHARARACALFACVRGPASCCSQPFPR